MQPKALSSRLLWLVAFLAILGVGIMAGCSAMKKVKDTPSDLVRSTRRIISSGGNLQKKVGLVAFTNQTAYRQELLSAELNQQFRSELSRGCANLRLVGADDADAPELLINPPAQRTGQLDNLALADEGRQHGFQVIIKGRMASISIDAVEKGFWLLRDTHHYLRLLIILEIYDMETGAKFLDHNYFHEMEVEEDDVELWKANQEAFSPVLISSIQASARQLAEIACDTLVAIDWKGYVVEAQDDLLIISSGAAAGLKPGMKFDAVERVGTITGKDGERFYLPGAAIGQVEILTVADERAEARSSSGEAINVGSTIK